MTDSTTDGQGSASSTPATPSAPSNPSTGVSLERTGDTAVARLPVKLLDDKPLRVLGQMLDRAAADGGPAGGPKAVVLDMSRVQIIPSIGLGALVQLHNECKARQQKLKLAAVLPQVRQILGLTRLDRVFELSDSVEAAQG